MKPLLLSIVSAKFAVYIAGIKLPATKSPRSTAVLMMERTSASRSVSLLRTMAFRILRSSADSSAPCRRHRQFSLSTMVSPPGRIRVLGCELRHRRKPNTHSRVHHAIFNIQRLYHENTEPDFDENRSLPGWTWPGIASKANLPWLFQRVASLFRYLLLRVFLDARVPEYLNT